MPTETKPPEWWTDENTRQWQSKQWKLPAGEQSEAMREWGSKHSSNIPKPVSRAALVKPPTAAEYKAWEKDFVTSGAPRPSFFDNGETTLRAKEAQQREARRRPMVTLDTPNKTRKRVTRTVY
jgi:hypothetical protein